ncbi:MAG: alpha/beta fold hydrolase [Acetobacteraceae bacterium]|nr:alpha/beta fold hydrolase [Acetobacteraceae bacterium]
MDNWNPRPLDPGTITLHRRGTGKPLVLLHCLGQSWRFWDVLDPLMDRNELIAYSFPGHAGTPLPGRQYGVEELTGQLRAVALREGLTKFHLMGISLGGSVARHFAGTYPDMVDRLVLADCTPVYDPDARANWPVRAAAARRDGVKSLIPMLMQVFFTPGSIEENGPNVRHVRETFEACDGEAHGLACETLATLDTREQTRKITARTLILLGSNERQSFKDAAKWMHEAIADSRVVEVPIAAHASVRERPAFAIEQLRAFLDQETTC